MIPFPLDPMAQHQRFMAAFCRDLASGEFIRTGKTPQADAVAEIVRQTRSPKPA